MAIQRSGRKHGRAADAGIRRGRPLRSSSCLQDRRSRSRSRRPSDVSRALPHEQVTRQRNRCDSNEGGGQKRYARRRRSSDDGLSQRSDRRTEAPLSSSPRSRSQRGRPSEADIDHSNEHSDAATTRSRGGNRSGGPHALFLMGLPGAGKTTVKKRRMHRGDVDIEPDRFKSRHYRFHQDMGEETDDEVHRWSVRRAADAFEDALMSPRKPNLVFDSSGSNASWLGRRIKSARRAGYSTELLWVDVPVEVALLRNRDRATLKGGRWCPEEVIVEKAKVLSDSFEELRKEVDSAERLQNWSGERSKEHSVALEDLYIYPAPRTRPPSLRPGDSQYGEAPPGARSPSPTRGSMRTIRIAPWRRNDEVMRQKSARLAYLDRKYRGNRERFVEERVLRRRDVYLEPNRFPYQLPPGIEHWTIWSRRTFRHKELCEYIESWLDARKPHNVVAWNYDDNRGRRTIAIWHVHIYFEGADGQMPNIGHDHDHHEREDSPPKHHSVHRSPCSV